MENRISNLKIEFNNISLIRTKIIEIFESLKIKIDKLKILHSEFIKNSKSQLFVFGLDSFHFQSKLIDLEYDDMKRMFLAINNRMYCEYFKLYKIIISYISENVSDKKIMEIIKGNNFPVYKDLEPFKEYKFEIISEIHENIVILLNSITSIIDNRENELSLHKNKQLIGLNIDNFVNTFNYEIVIMREKIILFLTYIEFFHKLHTKYLKRFNNKIQLMYSHINSDIHFDDSIETNKKKKEMIDDFKDEKIDLTLVNEIQKSIDHDDFNYDVYEKSESIVSTQSSDSNANSNYSFKSNYSLTKDSNFKIPKIIKTGMKKMSDIITGCNNKNIESNVTSNSLTSDLLDMDNIIFTNNVMPNIDSNMFNTKNDLSLSLLEFSNENMNNYETNLSYDNNDKNDDIIDKNNDNGEIIEESPPENINIENEINDSSTTTSIITNSTTNSIIIDDSSINNNISNNNENITNKFIKKKRNYKSKKGKAKE
jgi:hypothetical protein